MLFLLCLALFLPLFSFLILALFGNHFKRKIVSTMGPGVVFISFVCFLALAFHYFGTQNDEESFFFYDWISIKGIHSSIILHLDHLALLMALIITGVGFLIHVYSIGYMEDEKDLSRYFAYMNLFIFSMLLLVLAGDLLLLFVGWEGVGLSSYLLIGYWYERPQAAAAATKAFIVNRIGDLGFILAIVLALILFGTTNIAELTQKTSPNLTLLTLLLLCGAIAKSAQVPLQVWLPDAMEGPTPVSALIHAATMVTAGVYLIARLHTLFLLSPFTLHVVGIIGGITALLASLAALNQTDLKRVLAYSTISQLGLMFLACGIGAFYAAMFHLTMHAFIKALLFLSAGNVIHKMHGITEMGKMGGLSKQFPTTHWLFLIGVLALSGVPPFAAFFSKDLILEVEYLIGWRLLFYTAVATSILTGIYMIRAYFLTFWGPPLKEHSHVEEAPRVMLTPVKILALLSIIGGFIGFFSTTPTPFLEHYLEELDITPAEKEFTQHFWSSQATWFSILMAVGAVGIGTLLYTQFANRLKAPLPLLKKGFYFDAIYQKLIVTPYTAFSQFIVGGVEPKVFDRLIDVSQIGVEKTATSLQKTQSGQIRSYAAWMVIGGVILLIYFARQAP